MVAHQIRWVSYILEATKCGSMDFKNRSRKIARKRFWREYDKSEYQCPDCGRGVEEIRSQTFEVHHIDGDPYNNSMDNLVGLCRLCHNIREGKKPSLNEIKELRRQTSGETTNTVNGSDVEHLEPESKIEDYSEVEIAASYLFHELEEYLIRSAKFAPSKSATLKFKNGEGIYLNSGYHVEAEQTINCLKEKIGEDFGAEETVERVNEALDCCDVNPLKRGGWIGWEQTMIGENCRDIRRVESFESYFNIALKELISKFDPESDRVFESVDELDNVEFSYAPKKGVIDWGDGRLIFFKVLEYDDFMSEWGCDDEEIARQLHAHGVATAIHDISNGCYRMIDLEDDFVQEWVGRDYSGMEENYEDYSRN